MGTIAQEIGGHELTRKPGGLPKEQDDDKEMTKSPNQLNPHRNMTARFRDGDDPNTLF
jgi:hypothetical protein